MTSTKPPFGQFTTRPSRHGYGASSPGGSSPKAASRPSPSLPRASEKKPRKTPQKKGGGGGGDSWTKRLLRGLLSLCIWGVAALSLAVLWFSYDLPDIQQLQAPSRKPSVTVQTQDGYVIGTYGDLHEDAVQLKDLPIYVPQALLAVEDRRFYHHFGIDFIGLIRAAYANYKAHRIVQGGSSITQQLAKNFLLTQGLYKTNDRSMRRKVQEALMAMWLEWNFKKEQILTIYLNRVYFGAGTYGIDAASRKYFGKSATKLTVFEAAVIAGLLKAPSKYSPAQHPERAKNRAKVVLEQMVEARYIPAIEPYLSQGAASLAERQKDQKQGSRFFADWIYDSIPNYVSLDQDLVVVTTLDSKMQMYAENACAEWLQKMGKELNTSEVAMVVMTPQGEIKAMVGGKDYSGSQFNRATQAYRQPGSSFKPFVYLTALESGLTLDTRIQDSLLTVGNWTPKNFRKWKERGIISMADALTNSVNAVTLRLALAVGTKKIGELVRRLGITTPLIEDFSICLGTTEVTLLELTAAYATFANLGKSVWAHGISEIRDKEGDILYQKQEPAEITVIKQRYMGQLHTMLEGVVNRGTGRAAKTTAYDAGKTGSNGDLDAWFMGYNALVAGVWTGNDTNKLMNKQSTGGRLPARVWHTFMENVLKDPDFADLKKEVETKGKERNAWAAKGVAEARQSAPLELESRLQELGIQVDDVAADVSLEEGASSASREESPPPVETKTSRARSRNQEGLEDLMKNIEGEG